MAIQELLGFKIGQIAYIKMEDQVDVYDGWHEVTITALTKDEWCLTNSRTGGWIDEFIPLKSLRIIPSDEPIATEKQMVYLKDLGYEDGLLSKSDASAKIDELKAWKNAIGSCHYCGGPAYGFGFFSEPACKQCGGK